MRILRPRPSIRGAETRPSSDSGVQVVDEEHDRPPEPGLLEGVRVLLRAATQHGPGEVRGYVEVVGRLRVAEDVEVEELEGVRLPEPPLQPLRRGISDAVFSISTVRAKVGLYLYSCRASLSWWNISLPFYWPQV